MHAPPVSHRIAPTQPQIYRSYSFMPATRAFASYAHSVQCPSIWVRARALLSGASGGHASVRICLCAPDVISDAAQSREHQTVRAMHIAQEMPLCCATSATAQRCRLPSGARFASRAHTRPIMCAIVNNYVQPAFVVLWHRARARER